MKKVLLLIAMVVTGYNVFAFTTQGVWRWRNDNGSETSATWKANQNTPITIYSTDSVIRLRIELYNDGNGGLLDGALFEDSSNEPGGHWDTIKLAANSNAFMLAGTSPFVTDLTPTTRQLNGQSIPPYAFVAGKEIVATERLPNQTVPKTKTTEFEYFIKPTANIKPGVTYYFRVDAANYPTGYVFPSLISQANALPHASIADKSINEGNSGTSVLKFKVTLDQPYSGTVKIKYATADSTATAGSDYVATQGTMSFKPGTTSRTISVTINGDQTKEANEKFKVKLSKPVNAILLDSLGLGTIKNDDATALAPGSVVTENSKVIGAKYILNVYPNPAHSDITFTLKNYRGAVLTATLNNVSGKTVHQELIELNGSDNYKLNLQSKLTAGVYFLQLKGEALTENIKVVVQ